MCPVLAPAIDKEKQRRFKPELTRSMSDSSLYIIHPLHAVNVENELSGTNGIYLCLLPDFSRLLLRSTVVWEHCSETIGARTRYNVADQMFAELTGRGHSNARAESRGCLRRRGRNKEGKTRPRPGLLNRNRRFGSFVCSSPRLRVPRRYSTFLES